MIRAAILGATVLAATLPVAAKPIGPPGPSLEVGKPFPLVSLPVVGNAGKRQSIEPYRGRKVMLHLFASW